jgi:general secretion pathway protein H
VPKHNQGGFTLLEIVVVLFIIGVITGVALLNVAGDPAADAVEAEGKRLAALIQFNREAATLRLEERGLRLEESEYRWFVLEDGDWLPAMDAGFKTERQLPGGLTLALSVEEFPAELKGESESTGAINETEEQLPQVWLSSTGEMLPFEIVLRDPSDRHRFFIRGNANGTVETLIESDVE